MAILDLALWACVVVFMVGSLAGVGLGLSPRDVLAPLANRRFVTLTLVVSWLVCPAIAYVLLQVISLEQHYATGLVLMALAPCAPFAPAMVQKAEGDLAYMATFVILSTVATVVVMPIAVPWLVGLSVGAWSIAQPLLLFVMVPLLLGMFVRIRHPHAADRARSPIAAVTNVAGGVLLLLMPVMYGRGVLDAVGSYAIATQIAFIGLVTAVAHRLGSSLPDDQRSVLTLGVCTRNLGAALAPLAAIDPDPRTVVMIAIGGPVTVGLSWLTARWLARLRDAGRLKPAPTSLLTS